MFNENTCWASIGFIRKYIFTEDSHHFSHFEVSENSIVIYN